MYKAIDTAMSKAEGRLKEGMPTKKRKRDFLKKTMDKTIMDGKGGCGKKN